MIYVYKPAQSKIAMGLLSFMYSHGDFQTLQAIMDKYEQLPEWKLFLYKENEDFIGLIGGRQGEEGFTIHHLVVSPSHRGEGLGCHLISCLEKQVSSPVLPSPRIEQLFEKWQERERHSS